MVPGIFQIGEAGFKLLVQYAPELGAISEKECISKKEMLPMLVSNFDINRLCP